MSFQINDIQTVTSVIADRSRFETETASKPVNQFKIQKNEQLIMEKQTVELVIVVPCYNEFSRLSVSTYVDFIQTHSDVLFCFVNDGSTDKTLEILLEMEVLYKPYVYVLNLETNLGKGEAVRRGLLASAGQFNAKYFCYLDADLSAPLQEAVRLSIILKNSDLHLVFGSRVAIYGNRITRSLTRHYGGRIVATFISLTLDLIIYDTQCGLKVFKRSAIDHIFKDPFISRWLFDVEIFARFRQKYVSSALINIIKEVPLVLWEEKGNSKISILDILKIPTELLRIKAKY